jgi:hypothetical protein
MENKNEPMEFYQFYQLTEEAINIASNKLMEMEREYYGEDNRVNTDLQYEIY